MIAIISDIHGNFPALKAVLKDIELFCVRKIYSLGDVAGYYSMINECVELLIRTGVESIMGNHDYYLLSGKACPRSHSANICLDFQRQSISMKNRQWLEESFSRIDIENISMVHGGWHDCKEEYIYDAHKAYFAGLESRYFFSGHTHVQILKKFERQTYCNPGSIGQPRDGDSRSAYALFDTRKGQIFLRRVGYPIDEIVSHMKSCGFAPFFYENLYKGARISGRIDNVI